MKYPKWAPKLLLITSLLLNSCDFQKNTDKIKNKIENIISLDYQPEYIKNGNNRLLRVKGDNLDKLHTVAVQEFIKKIEKEIKNPRNSFIMSNFKTNVDFIGGKYLFEYSLNLNPSKNLKPQRVIDIRGTVWNGVGAKNKVLKLNEKKIPSWQKNMEKFYSGVSFEQDISSNNGLFHEAVLAKAEKIK